MKKSKDNEIISSSFRDPSGFMFYRGESFYRQINFVYKENYDHLMDSGLYQLLVDEKLLIPHTEVSIEGPQPEKAYKIIKPDIIPLITYPYEWCFSQLKDAAISMLKIQRKAIDYGMSLKDCSSYNIQFKESKPILIDTLSFEKYQEGRPWSAYQQFCQHFLSPLALMSYRDIRLNQLLRIYIDGVPLDLASSLLPIKTRFSFSLLSHLHLHSKSQKHYSDKKIDTNKKKIKAQSFLAIIDSLNSAVSKLKCQDINTEWANYYEDTNYSSEALQSKKKIVSELLDEIEPKNIWDLGANIGVFSQIACNKGIDTVSFDIDPVAVEKNYHECVANSETKILPLIIDLANPSPSIGWENNERMSLIERGPVDAVLALALIHHLAISNNLPLNKIARFFKKICRFLIIEFIPKSDSQVQRILKNRADIFSDYLSDSFIASFSKYFIIQRTIKIRDSNRTICLMKKK